MPWILPAPAAPPPTAPSTAGGFVSGVPQMDAPFRLDSHGRPVTVPQGSAEDVGACAYNLCACPQGAYVFDTQFGIPLLPFQDTPLNLAGVISQIQQYEPRAASVTATDVADIIDQSTRNVAVFVDVDTPLLAAAPPGPPAAPPGTPVNLTPPTIG